MACQRFPAAPPRALLQTARYVSQNLLGPCASPACVAPPHARMCSTQCVGGGRQTEHGVWWLQAVVVLLLAANRATAEADWCLCVVEHAASTIREGDALTQAAHHAAPSMKKHHGDGTVVVTLIQNAKVLEIWVLQQH
eukprot:CAMPEP_0174755346 /NCGR_PEP_ID=MMETSP1094-20130205/106200_1 /TAXON_ID=156173 /ORGANISM="Chrysochromulina brevifilum, Strain UTEX LB 985" /LENGTH=137 /DNA_ID=CAMNT_0015961235 /DNA_START=1778 /DNA_END=2192 /DNA_ORIENTATION=-